MAKLLTTRNICLSVLICAVATGILGFADTASAESRDIGYVILADEAMRHFAVCPAGDIAHTLTFFLVDISHNPIPDANTRISFFTNAEPPSVVFCHDPVGGQSEYFYPESVNFNEYTYTFSLSAGVILANTSHNVRMRVEWGPNFENEDTLLPFISSPDLTGDLVVNLGDVGQFAQVYNGTYDLQADLNHDGVINLADVGVFSVHVAHTCR